MERWNALKGVEEVWKIISQHLEDWPNVQGMDPGFVEAIVEPFQELMSEDLENLDCLGESEAYYIGQVEKNKPHGIGMHRTNFPTSSDGYKQMLVSIGSWKEGKAIGTGIIFSMRGDEVKWYVECVNYNSEGKPEGEAYRITPIGVQTVQYRKSGAKGNSLGWFLLVGVIVLLGLIALVNGHQQKEGTGKISVSTVGTASEKFEDFIRQFLSSASFQYSRMRFPFRNVIEYSADNGEMKSISMTRKEWPLVQEMSVYNDTETFGAYKIKNQTERIYEMGYVNSELTLRLVFKKISGKWMVIDGGNWGWYPGMDMTERELAETIKEVQKMNAEFMTAHP